MDLSIIGLVIGSICVGVGTNSAALGWAAFLFGALFFFKNKDH